MSRLKTDQLPLKRKAFSFAGFPVLAQQRFSSLRKQTQTALNSLVTKENYESVNTSKRQFRRMDTSYLTSVSEDNSDTGREKKHSSLKMLSEEHNDWLVKNNYATICSGSRRDIKWCDTLVFSSIVSSRLARPLVSCVFSSRAPLHTTRSLLSLKCVPRMLRSNACKVVRTTILARIKYEMKPPLPPNQ